jgi:hypothetical protein
MELGILKRPAATIGLVLSASLLSTCGCSTFRNVEQWKCDNLGMCHFGIRPSVEAPPADISGFDVPGPACSQCPPAGY